MKQDGFVHAQNCVQSDNLLFLIKFKTFFDTLNHEELHEHIERVGVVFYVRQSCA